MTFPGRFEAIVGYKYINHPEILRGVINAGEPVSLNHWSLHNDGELVYNGGPILKLKCDAIWMVDDQTVARKMAEDHIECISLLLSLGADVNQKSADNMTMLYRLIAAFDSHHSLNVDVLCRIIAFLRQRGARPDISSFDMGNTALHCLANGHDYLRIDIVEILVFGGNGPVDMCVPNAEGLSPLALAIRRAMPPELVESYLKIYTKQMNEMWNGFSSGDIVRGSCAIYPLLLVTAEAGEYACFEKTSEILIKYGADITDRIKIIGDNAMRRIVDIVLENKNNRFREHVVEYYRLKKRELGIK